MLASIKNEKEDDTKQGNDDSLLSQTLALAQAFWRYSQGRRGIMLATVLLLLSAELMRLAQPWLAGTAINILQDQGVNGLSEAGKYLSMVFGVILVVWVFQAWGCILERTTALHVRSSFTVDLMTKLLRAPLWWYRREHPTLVAQRALQGGQSLNDFGDSQFIYLQSPVQIIGALGALTLISPWVGLAAFIGTLTVLLASLGFDNILLRLYQMKNTADRRNAATWSDLLGNFLSVHALRLSIGALSLTSKRLEAIFVPARRVSVIIQLKWGAIDILGTLLWCSLVALYVVITASKGDSSVIALGGVFMVYEYARRLEIEMSAIAADFSMLAGQMSGFHAAKPLLDAPASTAIDTPLQASAWQQLELSDVNFRYQQQGKQQTGELRQVNLKLQRGKRYALIGASGGGKSTLMLLLAGLESPNDGMIKLDGESITSVELRREACLIPTATTLFEGDVKDNVAPGFSEQDDADLETIHKVLGTVGLTEHLNSLSDGLNSIVGEGSSRWSAGQQQRLALARGILPASQASLVLMDESTSHLDELSSRKVFTNILEELSGKTVIAAIHNLGLLNFFDEVIYVDAGRIVDVDTIEELRNKYPIVSRMLDQQTTEPLKLTA